MVNGSDLRNCAALRPVCIALLALPSLAQSAGIPTGAPLEEIVVTARRAGLVGESQAASEGIVPAIQLAERPILRPGEVLEAVPGLVVTQHSGDGKANQYFLRGFNLDHGTDFATYVDGLPVNMPTHAHGQGYSDINFLIHELVEFMQYRKGTYYAEEGNFSAAGAARIHYVDEVAAPRLDLTIGQDAYYRVLGAASPEVAGGRLLLGLDWSSGDGPWTLPQDFQKTSGVVKFTRGDDRFGYSVTGMGYDGSWNSTDQIPQRAVDSGEIPRFGYVDATTGGESHRYSLSLNAWSRNDDRGWTALAYGIDYYLDLISNFTYALDQERGDQFEQYDDRRIYGGRFVYDAPLPLGSIAGRVLAGAEVRQDDIHPVALYRTEQRERFDTIRKDDVRQTGYAGFLAYEQQWNGWLRSTAGLRYDYLDFKVDSNLQANSGNESDSLWGPKLTVVLGPWAETEVFLNAGRGFHSNDARGTTIEVDPNDGVTPVDTVNPIVPANGTEIGVRTAWFQDFQLTAALWNLDIDSELLFVGDGGITEPSRGTRRYGVELGAFWTPLDWVIVDADYSWSHARFTDPDPAGDYIPGALETVVAVGLAVTRDLGWHGGARLRYFGAAPLIEDGSARSDSTMIVNAEVGYRFTNTLRATLTVFNLFDADDNDITYFYESQLPGEPAPVEDFHFHPVEPRTLRFTLGLSF